MISVKGNESLENIVTKDLATSHIERFLIQAAELGQKQLETLSTKGLHLNNMYRQTEICFIK